MYIRSTSKHHRSGTTMQKHKQRGSEARFRAAREILPGFPKRIRFESDQAVAEYLAGDVVCCLLCGKHYKQLAGHLRVHGVDADQYREMYNIRSQVGLEGSPTKERHRAAAVAQDFGQVKPLTPMAERKPPRKAVFTTYTKENAVAHLRAISPKAARANRRPRVFVRGLEMTLSQARFLEHVAAGKTAMEACQELGIGRTSYKRWIKASALFSDRYKEAKATGGAGGKKFGGRPREFDHDEALRLHSEGLSCVEISQKMGVGYHAVYRVCST